MAAPGEGSDVPVGSVIEKYLDWTEEQLYAALGGELIGGGLGVGGEDEEANGRFARNWFSRNLDDLRSKVCLTPQAQAIMGSKGDRVVEVSTIADLLSQATSMGSHPSLIVSVLIARIGLEAFCRDVTSNPRG